MADSNHLSARVDELTDDDPFAELTRIMGQGAFVRPLPVDDGVDTLALDLEKELLGDFTDHQGAGAGFAEDGQSEYHAAGIFSDDDFASDLFKGTDLDEFEKALASEPIFEDQDFANSDFTSAEFTNPKVVSTYLPDEHYQLDAEPQVFEPEPILDSGIFGGYGQPEPAVYGEPEMAAEPAYFEPAFDLTGATYTLRGVAPVQEAYSEANYQVDHFEQEVDGLVLPTLNESDFQVEHALDTPQPDSPASSYAHEGREPFALSDLRIEEELEKALDFAPDWNDEPEAEHQLNAATEQSWQPATEQTQWSYDGPPEIDTVEIPEKAVAITESLDLPHAPYREEVKSAVQVDEIEELLSGAFGGMNHKTPQIDEWSEPQHADIAQQNADFDAMFDADLAAASAASMARKTYASADPQFDDAWNDSHNYDQSPRPMPGTPPPLRASGGFLNHRMTTIAALLAGVAILGAAGVYAFNQFGDGFSNEATLIKADNSPVKVKPENPGGTTIPNQDSQVYRQVAGETPASGAEQKQLVSTSEEPVQLSPQSDQLDQLVGQEVGSPAEELTDVLAAESTVKSDDRLVSTGNEASQTESHTMLTPRRVRSFVVRPDGTMVQREVEVPAEVPAQQAVAQALPGVENDRVAVAVPGGVSAAVESVGESTVAIPRSAPIPTARPNNVTRPAPSAPVAQAPIVPAAATPAPTQVAAVQPTAPVASAAQSGWSVQIASQPSLEAAQQSYQSLAQRHGTMLQGKGVNIVKADVQGKGTYYRVRIPAASKGDAISLCESLKSQGGNCFVSQ